MTQSSGGRMRPPERDYSAVPLARKLGIVAGSRVLLHGAAPELLPSLAPLPDGVELLAGAATECDVIVAFPPGAAALLPLIADLRTRLTPAGGLWLAWPKRASGVVTDLDESAVRTAALASGLVDNKIASLGPVHSALRLVVRRRDRG